MEAMKIAGMISAFFILILVFLERQSLMPGKYLLLTILPLMALWSNFIFKQRKEFLQAVSISLAGLIYIALPFGLLFYISRSPLSDGLYNPEILIGTLIIIWTYDSGAYITGILFGKHKMAPAISPKKSWEGFFGGMVFAILAGFIFSRLASLLSTADWLILSIIIVLAGTAGDFLESVIKREAGVKDSGKIMPGHGGILDRFDSLLLIIPFVFLYIYLIKI